MGFNGAAFSRTRKPRAHRRIREADGFNGAAFSRTRKRTSTKSGPRPIFLLQWGRVLTNAETDAARDALLVGSDASMGPRSHERGNAIMGQA